MRSNRETTSGYTLQRKTCHLLFTLASSIYLCHFFSFISLILPLIIKKDRWDEWVASFYSFSLASVRHVTQNVIWQKESENRITFSNTIRYAASHYLWLFLQDKINCTFSKDKSNIIYTGLVGVTIKYKIWTILCS